MQVPPKAIGKLRFSVFFQCFVVPEGRKVGSLKRRVWSHVVGPGRRDEKLHAVVVRSPNKSQLAPEIALRGPNLAQDSLNMAQVGLHKPQNGPS